MPFLGDGTAIASAPAPRGGVYEVKLDTTTATAAVLVAPKAADYDADVLAPLHAAQAAAAAKAAADAAARAKARRVVYKAPAIQVAGSHADWMRAAGIAESDFGYVDYIIDHESGWGVTKYNYGGSGAYGLGQALPASKMAVYGADYMTNPVTQLKWANAYAVGRYGSWAGAYSHWITRHSW
ncbi:MAG TPA: lytic transglycosylase domain-containing protein [Candidatus Saccharimonadia bacterium]|nr:lytic transglycosylase domain-containing protein [Candidatus Saccharimonadia bacterium]